MTGTITQGESTVDKVEDVIVDPESITISQEYEDLVPEISESEFGGPMLDPYRQVGISGDTRAIYNDLIASKDRRLRRRRYTVRYTWINWGSVI